ncbi:C4-dicarboxylate TRAP transporter substrate-binding protein [Phaeobacter sp. J2-8]|uniref:C4-dicarboxylate TRAP transporter substrate-binding protein n=1 Tax=Phaeobacter sp. J2-8 TaxID=2931394 RepID=UPI001FD42CC2|nr:C4-dicarboxylate TRAP transporter substrate-binding protein [Phaeobacter sp. J2-8]MCJ7873368.1 C4-dicarboxylate TRAP transporter substrate-binding protein [Phaeobacter sp. J2-8]
MRRTFKTAALGLTLVAGLASAALAEVTIKVAYENNPGEPVDLVVNKWAETLAERSNGEITLELYPSSQLGSKQDVTEQALLGSNVVTITDVGFLADFVPDLGILFGPYLSESPEALFAIYESDWFKEKEQELAEKGVHVVMTNYLYGTRHLIATKPVRTPEDLKGLKIRTPNNVMQIKAIEAMGGTATPMPLGEAYTALSQGIIDGVENPLAVIYGGRFHEEAKYLNMIGYLLNTSVFIGGEAFFASLSEEDLAMIHETAHEAGLYSQQLAEQNDAAVIAKMEEAGVEVIYPDVGPFKEAAAAVYDEFPEWSEGLYEEIQSQLGN